jgi:hypothetical protein
VFLFQTQQVMLIKRGVQGIAFNGANYPILTHTRRE